MFMEIARRRVRILTALVIALTAVAAGCGGDDGAEPAPPAQTAATAVTTPTETVEPEVDPESGASADLALSIEQSDLGPHLVGPDGGTLYVFLRDDPATTNCSGGCLQAWPPLIVDDGQQLSIDGEAPGSLDSIATPSGRQVTYNDAPLYYFANDAATGDLNGHLAGGVWFLARPDTASTRVVGVREDGPQTPYLVGPTGMTLYLFANDTAGVSNCNGQCIENWPALAVPDGIEPSAVALAGGALAVVVRDDETQQATYDGRPLYYFARDTRPGDTTGDGLGGVWELARP